MNIYDIRIANGTTHTGEANHDWCFDLPLDIHPEQRPLDPDTSYPLMRSFTLLLPEGYQMYDPEIVALGFFSLTPDQSDNGPTNIDGIHKILVNLPAQPLAETEPQSLWEAGRNSHPHLHRMEDILGDAYALILLNTTEFSGMPYQSPALPAGSPPLVRAELPQWLEVGSTASFVPDWAEDDCYLLHALGGHSVTGHQ